MNTEDATRLLHGERRRIERTLEDVNAHDPDDLTPQQKAAEDELRRELLEDLEAVGRAEARLADGTYGLSVESGKPIPDERLEAFPAAERTEEEQERFERGGGH
jgi:RNA polymerase-binding transcription factor